jgi:hypothetical protein
MSIRNIKRLLCATMVAILFVACDDNEPQKEDVPELITKVTLTFTPASGTTVIVHATDPDGEGVQDLAVDSPIILEANKTYVMSISLANGLAEPTSPDYNVTQEVEEHGDEHMFFFGWTGNLFTNPTGSGNILNRESPVNYSGDGNSVDQNNLPLGLSTTWTTANSGATATFRILLKHQPGLKSNTSTSSDGETDVDVTFELKIQ